MQNKIFGGSMKQSFLAKNWHFIYFVLAAFDVVVICVSLYLSHNNLYQYDQAIEFTKSKIKILALVGEVSQSAQQVNAPGNDVFDSKNAANERERFANAKAVYEKKLSALQSTINANALNTKLNDDSTTLATKDFEDINLSMSGMSEVAGRIFDFFEKKEAEKAAALMAEMDRRYAKLNHAIEVFRVRQRDQIEHILDEHHKNLSATKKLEIYFSILIVLAVFGSAVFGTHISRFVKTALTKAQRNHEILETVSNAAIVAFTDIKGKITEVNDNFCEISGYTREELVGQDHRIISSGVHPKSFFKELWQKISSGEIWTGDIQNIKKNGEPYFLRSVISPLTGASGDIEKYMAIRFDVSEQRRLEIDLLNAQATAKIGSWTFDLASNDLSWSTEHYRIFEIDEPQSPENLYKLYRERIHPDDLTTLDRLTTRVECGCLVGRNLPQ